MDADEDDVFPWTISQKDQSHIHLNETVDVQNYRNRGSEPSNLIQEGAI